MDRVEFRERFDRVKKIDAGETPGEYVLLSINGILKTVSRSSKMKAVKYPCSCGSKIQIKIRILSVLKTSRFGNIIECERVTNSPGNSIEFSIFNTSRFENSLEFISHF